MVYILISGFALFLLGIIEASFHRNNRARIPTIIHVNGTRGKSTTTRLIAAGLREAGLRVIAKTTGTAPRLILEDGQEEPIKRRGKPNIIEYLKVVSFASRREIDILVTECMALSPEMQWISEKKMLMANIGVITNVGADHLEVMGPLISDVAENMALMVPQKGKLVTPDGKFNEFFTKKTRERKTDLILTDPQKVPDRVLEAFPYISFKENIATALKVCELLGVKEETSLAGMVKAEPDPGVSAVKRIVTRNSDILFVNAFAANDNKSTLMTWEIAKKAGSGRTAIGLLNNRSDRPLRIFQLADLLQGSIKLDKLVLLGDWGFNTRRVIKGSFSRELVDLTRKKKVVEIIDNLVAKEKGDLLLFGFGNTRGAGEEIIKFFKENGEGVKC